VKGATVARVCLGRTLRHYRRKAGLEQRKAGDVIGVDQSGYSKYERGMSPVPAHSLILLTPHLDTSASDIMHYAGTLYEVATREAGWLNTPKELAKILDEILSLWEEEEDNGKHK